MDQTYLNDYKSKKNHVTYLLNIARREFYTKFMEENSVDQRKMFTAAKKLLNLKHDLRFSEHLDKSGLANDIGTFFVSKVERIRANIDANISFNSVSHNLVPDDKPVMDTSRILHSFKSLSESEVYNLIQRLAKKSCILDPMPTSLVCNSLDLLPVITKMVNTSLSTAYFPSGWKEAIVKPLLKKGAADSAEYTNLRPVSNLQFISKVTERAVFDQLYAHMTSNELFPILQSAYRKFHSTETALLKVVNDIFLNMNRKHVTLLVLLDLSAAFDTVDHSILLHRLETSFGVKDSALKWITSYLSNRSQRVSIDETLSESYRLPSGVPQGSCLGPLLFTVYASKLFKVIKYYLPDAHAYADETQLYLAFKPDSSTSEIEALEEMEKCVRAVRAWMISDKLKLNEDKTEVIFIGTRQQLNKVRANSIVIGDSVVSPVNVVRDLGILLDCNMNFNAHISKLCSLSFYTLHNIRRIRKYLNPESAKALVIALVIGRLDYCNSLFYGLPAVQINKLQRIQNAAARLISNIPRFAHISPVLIELHWLPVKYRIIFKIILLTYKSLNGCAPSYISELISLKQKGRYNLRSCSECLLTVPNDIMKKTMGERAFAAAAPSVWNKKPNFLRNQPMSLNSFKKSLKTYLFKLAF